MAQIPIYNGNKEQVGELTLQESLLSEKINEAVVHQAIKRYLASKHHGTVDTKTRAEVLRTSKKIYRQKGTGQARHGSRKSSPFIGGGRVFGPHQRDYSIGMTRKVRTLALREVLRNQVINGGITILDSIPLTQFKTKEAKSLFTRLGVNSGLVILDVAKREVERSIRNLKGFKVITLSQINVFDLVKYPQVVLTSKAFDILQTKYLA